MRRKCREDWPLLGALALTLAAFALRAWDLPAQSLWSDEIFVYRFTGLPLHQMWPALARSEPHPPLYYTLIHLWRQVVGTSEESLRFPSLFFGVLGVPGLYILGKRLFGAPSGLLAALVLAANPFHLWYAQEARMYTMPVAGAILAIYALWRAMQSNQRRWWVMYFLATSLGLGAHYFAALPLAAANSVAIGVYLGRVIPIGGSGHGGVNSAATDETEGSALTQRRPFPRGWLMSNGVIAGLLLLWVGYIWHIVTVYPGWMQKTGLLDMLWRSAVAFSLGTSFPPQHVLFAGAACATLATVCGVLIIWRPPDGYTAPVLLLAWGLGTLVGTFILQELLRRPMYHERYVIVASPAFYLIVVAGLVRCWSYCKTNMWRWSARLASTAALLGLLAIFIVSIHGHFTNPTFAKGEMRDTARHIDALAGDGDVLLVVPARAEIYEYYTRRPLPLALIENMEGLQRDLPDLLAKHQRVWFLPYFNIDTDIYAERWLAENAFLVEHRWVNNARLMLFSRPESPLVARQRSIEYSNGLQLVNLGIGPERVEPGQVVHFEFHWMVPQRVTGDPKISLRLVDGDDRTIAQADRDLADRFRPVAGWPIGTPVIGRIGLMVPPDAPPREYRLQSVVYVGGEIRFRDGTESGSVLPLGKMVVVPPTRTWTPAAVDLDAVGLGRLAPGLRLLAAAWPVRTYNAGDTLPITLRWWAEAVPDADYAVCLEMVDKAGQVITRQVQTPVDQVYPAGLWLAGQLVRDQQSFRIPRSVAGGEYTMKLSLLSTDGQTTGSGKIALGKVLVQARPVNTQIPAIAVPLQANLGNEIELLGHNQTAGEFGPGLSIPISLYWRAITETDTEYKVFVHLVGPDGQVWGQHDAPPCNGSCPTSRWATGEVITDEHTITIKAGAPAGQYRLLAGMYNTQTGQRLPTSGQASRPEISSVELTILTIQ